MLTKLILSLAAARMTFLIADNEADLYKQMK